ncbi:hypothetical protein V8C42DRAFT_6549 [Trichoderma barbatum]
MSRQLGCRRPRGSRYVFLSCRRDIILPPFAVLVVCQAMLDTLFCNLKITSLLIVPSDPACSPVVGFCSKHVVHILDILGRTIHCNPYTSLHPLDERSLLNDCQPDLVTWLEKKKQRD